MDASQKYFSLPLPKIYRPPIVWKIGLLFVYLVVLPPFLLILISFILISFTLSPPNLGFFLLALFFCFVWPLIILGLSFQLINQFCLRLELRPQGVRLLEQYPREYAPQATQS